MRKALKGINISAFLFQSMTTQVDDGAQQKSSRLSFRKRFWKWREIFLFHTTRWSTRCPKITNHNQKYLRVFLDKNFIARVPKKQIQHSKELVLRKRVAEQEESISLLMNAIDLLLEQ